MKKSFVFAKQKGFTLIELIVSVSIFVVVVIVVMAVLSMTVSSKSKIKGMNELRTEASKVMIEIQDMVGKGNWFAGGNVGVVIKPNNIFDPGLACVFVTDTSPNTLGSFYMDSRNIRIGRDIRLENDRIKLLKVIGGSSQDGFITSDNIEITSFSISGIYRDPLRAPACNSATIINVSITLRAKSSSAAGPAPELTLRSTFTSHYPGPDQAGDSVL